MTIDQMPKLIRVLNSSFGSLFFGGTVIRACAKLGQARMPNGTYFSVTEGSRYRKKPEIELRVSPEEIHENTRAGKHDSEMSLFRDSVLSGFRDEEFEPGDDGEAHCERPDCKVSAGTNAWATN